MLILKVSDVITAVKVSVSRHMACQTCLMDTKRLHVQGSEERGCKRQALLAVLAASIHKFFAIRLPLPLNSISKELGNIRGQRQDRKECTVQCLNPQQLISRCICCCRHQALRRAAQGIRGSLPDLAASIYQCIHRKDGRVLDEASEKLGAIRRQRQENLKSLRLAMEDWARSMHRKGAAERSQVLCTPKPGNNQSIGPLPCESTPRDCQVPEAGHGGVNYLGVTQESLC